MGKYEMGRTLGEGHFGKVRLARHADTGRAFAIKILDRQRILAMKIDDQVRACVSRGRPRRRFLTSFRPFASLVFLPITCMNTPPSALLLTYRVAGRAQIKREIATLKLLKHPNVVRLYEVKLLSSLLCPLSIHSVLLFFLPCWNKEKKKNNICRRRKKGKGSLGKLINLRAGPMTKQLGPVGHCAVEQVACETRGRGKS